MTNQEIDFVIDGLVEVVGSRNVYYLIDHLNIKLIKNSTSETLFLRFNGKENIFLSKDIPDKMIEFSLAYEIGHAILHNVEMWYLSKLRIIKT